MTSSCSLKIIKIPKGDPTAKKWSMLNVRTFGSCAIPSLDSSSATLTRN